MNRITSILISGIILLSFSFCGAKKNTTQNTPPFEVIEATYNYWSGGQPGVGGIKITIVIDHKKIKLEKVFFKNMKSALKQELNAENATFVGVFMLPNKEKDYILHENPIKEYGNTPPSALLEVPFEIKENEAVISYIYNGSIHYYKITNLTETKVKGFDKQ